MHPAPQYRTVLNWIQPTAAERYEIYSELGLPQAVLSLQNALQTALESRFGTYRIERKVQVSGVTVSDEDGSLIATIQTGWWGRQTVRFQDGRQLYFAPSNVFRSRWIWRDENGEVRAMIRRNQIFFSPDWPIREGLSALLTGLSIYFIVSRSSIFNQLMP